MRNGIEKFKVKKVFCLMVVLLTVFSFGISKTDGVVCKADTTSQEGEIVYKGQTNMGNDEYMGEPQDVYWIDASIQKPDNYTKIIGFKLTVQLTEIDYYGGGKETGSFACGMILASKGAHNPEEYIFTYPNGQSPEYELSNKDIVAFGVGEANWLISMVFQNGKGGNETMTSGDTATLVYQGKDAIFEEGNPMMTLVSFLGKFDYQSIEWIMGEPEQVEEEPWDKVKTIEFKDIATVSEDIQNGSNYLDITIPDTGKDSYPVVLWIHGGGYITGSKESCLLDNTKQYLLAQGYAFVSINYTLTGTEDVTDENGNTVTVYTEGGMPQMLYDAKAAVRFLRANKDAYKLDTRFIAAMGESAGAGLALLLGTTNGNPDYDDLSMGNAEYSSNIQAIVSFCGPTLFYGENIGNMYAYLGTAFDDYGADELEALGKFYSPTELVNSATPPMYLAYSKQDATVPFAHGEEMAEIAAIFMQEEDIVTAFYSEGGHVDRNVFDNYTSYTNVATFLNNEKDEVLATYEENNLEMDNIAEEPTGTSNMAVIIIIVAGILLAVIGTVFFIKSRKRIG